VGGRAVLAVSLTDPAGTREQPLPERQRWGYPVYSGPFHELPHFPQEDAWGYRLPQEALSAGRHGPMGQRWLIRAAHHEDSRRQLLLPELTDELQAIHTGHVVVANDQGKLVPFEQRQATAGIVHCQHAETLGPQVVGQSVEPASVVVDE
jgi:hypothetical protein